jgi:hopanoid biosynthesis associated radical SAM protein HpnH
MGVPLIQKYHVGRYVLAQKLRGRRRYPLVLMLEPLFQCNLACAGCGKIDYADEVLRRRMSPADALAAVDECGAPVVSIAGGEPLIHRELPAIVTGIVARRRFVYLCTNALLLEAHLDDYRPSPFLTFSVHLDGLRDRHDASVCREGVFDKAVAAIRAALARGFRVTINCTLFSHEDPEELAHFLDHATALGVEGITLSPGFSYDHAPRHDLFLGRRQSMQLFRRLFRLGRERSRRWPLNHSALYLDFLAGNQAYQCTPWSTPTYTVLGWQRPCYLLVDEGHAASFAELMAGTRWEHYGTGRNARCENCMAHCGYEGTAVDDSFARPLVALRVALRGPRCKGSVTPEPDALPTGAPAAEVPLANVGTARLRE